MIPPWRFDSRHVSSFGSLVSCLAAVTWPLPATSASGWRHPAEADARAEAEAKKSSNETGGAGSQRGVVGWVGRGEGGGWRLVGGGWKGIPTWVSKRTREDSLHFLKSYVDTKEVGNQAPCLASCFTRETKASIPHSEVL